jgi:hypothetical protein
LRRVRVRIASECCVPCSRMCAMASSRSANLHVQIQTGTRRHTALLLPEPRSPAIFQQRQSVSLSMQRNAAFAICLLSAGRKVFAIP